MTTKDEPRFLALLLALAAALYLLVWHLDPVNPVAESKRVAAEFDRIGRQFQPPPT